MNIALLFAGRVYTFEDCFPTINQYLLDEIKKKIPVATIDSFLSHNSANTKDNIESFCKLYNVKSTESIDVHTLCEQIIQNMPPVNRSIGNSKSIYMYYNWKRVFELMKEYENNNGINYDIVIYLRADMVIDSPIIFDFNLKDNTVYIPEGYDWCNGLNDQMAIGKSYTMNLYCNIIDNIDNIYKKHGSLFHTETYVKQNMAMHGVNVERFKMDYSLHKFRRA
jgi:hypothetical protein